MALSYELCVAEIEASKAALKQHEGGTEVHKVVIAAFEKELEKIPKPKKKEKV